MGTITIEFKNLCTFFTKKLADENNLMVGLIDLSHYYDIPANQWHTPQIKIESGKEIINPNGEKISKPEEFIYAGFPGRCSEHLPSAHTHLHQISGDIVFDFPTLAQGIAKDLSSEELSSPDEIIDLETDLYPNQPLKVNAALCKARLHFRNGTFYSKKVEKMVFTSDGGDAKPGMYAIHAVLKIDLSEKDYGILRFLNSDVGDFVFIGGRDYTVTISNDPPEHDDPEHQSETNHFQYYYKLCEAAPEPVWLPEPEINPEENIFCMVGGFSKADYKPVS